MTDTAIANLVELLFAIFVTVFLVFQIRNDNAWGSRANHMLHGMVLGNILLLSCCLLTWLMEGHAKFAGIDQVFTAGKCGLTYLIAGFYTEYLLCVASLRGLAPRSAGAESVKIRREAQVGWLLNGFGMLMNVLSVFNRMYFSCEGGVYHRGPLFLMNQTVGLLVISYDLWLIWMNRKHYEPRIILALILYLVLPLLALPLQFPDPDLEIMTIASTLSLLLVYLNVQVERSNYLAEKEKQLVRVNQAVFLNRIRPQYLYQILHLLQDKCRQNAPEAEQATEEFIEFLQRNVNSLKASRPIPFTEELQHTKSYLALEQKRFGELLEVVYDIRAVDFTLPALTLQPIAENAVRHGLMKRGSGGRVIIRTERAEKEYIVTVSDNGVGFTPGILPDDGRRHIGVANVRKRLQAMCQGSLELDSMPGRGCVATIRVPFS